MAFDARLLSGVGVMVAVAEAGSFVAAAEALGLTQSGVSRSIARLEGRLGFTLFNRTTRRTTLTDEGRRFFAQAAPALEIIEAASRGASDAAAAVKGHLRINADATLGHLLLAPGIPDFLRLNPEVTCELAIRDRMGDLVSDGFDVAVRFGDASSGGVIRRKLFDARVLTCASPDYLGRHGRPSVPADLLAHECILVRDPLSGRAFEWELQRGLEKTLVRVGGRLEVSDGASLLAACLAGHGIAQPFDFMARPLIDEGLLVQLLPDWADEVFPAYLFHRSRRRIPARLVAFLDFAVSRWSNPAVAEIA